MRHQLTSSHCVAIPVGLALSLLTPSCKEPDLVERLEAGDDCDPSPAADEPRCAEHLVCDPGEDADSFVCGIPLQIRGRVVTATMKEGIADADVLVFDATNIPVSDIVQTDPDGYFSLVAPARRRPDGTLHEDTLYTLGAVARDHLAYPSGIRPAIPLSVTEAVEEDGRHYVLDRTEAAVALISFPPSERTGVTVHGQILSATPAGTLVVANNGDTVRTAIADASGTYRLFNVPSGHATLLAFRRGSEFAPRDLTVDTSDLEGAELLETAVATARVRGSVNIVNAPGGVLTSVVLIPSMVFDETLERGPVPWGLRVPDSGKAPDVTGAFVFEGVPAGRYKVLAAFENDELVRDPDTSIAGTDIVEVDVAAGAEVSLETSFKLTASLQVVSPGADIPEAITGTPTFVFADDSSEERYKVVLYDALGNVVWADDAISGVSGSAEVQVSYAGPALEPGMYYQFRATSWKDKPKQSAISRTEDLRGVFYYEN